MTSSDSSPQPEPTLEPAEPKRRRRVSRIVVALVLLALLAAPPLWFGREILAWWTRMAAQARLSDGAITAAQQWLEWSERFDPSDGRTELLRARCLRHLYQQDRWKESVKLAEQKGAPAADVLHEAKLGLIQDGNLYPGFEDDLAAMSEAGVSANEIHAAMVSGYLARKDPALARLVLDAWKADQSDSAELAYLEGGYWMWMGKGENDYRSRRDCLEQARRQFETALARQPRHEMARVALAEWFEEQDRLEEALRQYAAMAVYAPASRTAVVRLAELLRRVGRAEEARGVLESLDAQAQTASEAAAQRGEIELQLGNYQEADRWFRLASAEGIEQGTVVQGRAISSALQENVVLARQLTARLDAVTNQQVRVDDLLSRLAASPSDAKIAEEVRKAMAPPAEPGMGPGAENRREGSAATAAELYAQHCSGCHGENGDGRGRAARHLFPKPRDLRTEKSRLASTVNGVPTREDIETVIRRGMPGTAMRAFDELSEDQRMLLAEEVRRLNRLGVAEHFVQTLTREGEEVDEEEVREVVRQCTTPGEAAPIPAIGPADPQAVARGKEAFSDLGCANCHGEEGTGETDLPLLDERGLAAPARDLVGEPLKGGQEPESVYLRILLGMPGTPHPACANVPENQIIDLVHYSRGLSHEPKQAQTNHERALRAWNTQND